MAANTSEVGINLHDHSIRRTRKIKISAAKKVRQNASRMPRVSIGQLSKTGAFAKKPLVLHITAAATINNRPRHTVAGENFVTIPCSAQHRTPQGIATTWPKFHKSRFPAWTYAGEFGFAKKQQKAISCDVEFSHACDVFCDRLCDDLFRSFSFPRGLTPILND